MSFFARPRKSRLSITPELPRAPRSMALAAQSAAALRLSNSRLRSSVAAAPIVRDMFVPVSPSGTGKTFSSFMSCRFCSSAALADRIMSRNSAASMCSFKRDYLHRLISLPVQPMSMVST